MVVWDMTSLVNLAVSEATQYMYTFTSPLDSHKMSLEILCKLCLHQSNLDLLLATTPGHRLAKLCQAIIEMSGSIIYYIISTRTIMSPTIPLLITFLEQVEEAAQHVDRHQGIAVIRDQTTLVRWGPAWWSHSGELQTSWQY